MPLDVDLDGPTRAWAAAIPARVQVVRQVTGSSAKAAVSAYMAKAVWV